MSNSGIMRVCFIAAHIASTIGITTCVMGSIITAMVNAMMGLYVIMEISECGDEGGVGGAPSSKMGKDGKCGDRFSFGGAKMIVVYSVQGRLFIFWEIAS